MGFFNSLFGKRHTKTLSVPFEKAKGLEKSGKYDEAIGVYKSYIEAHKADVEVYKSLAELYGRLEKWEEGIKVARLFDSRLSYLHDDWSRSFIQQAQNEISKNKSRNLLNVTSTKEEKKRPKPTITLKSTEERCNRVVENKSSEVEKKTQFPKKANYRGGSEHPSYIEQLQTVTASLPSFDFYTGDIEPTIPIDKAEQIKGIFREQEMTLQKAIEAEEQKDYVKAVSLYENLYKRKSLLPEAYERLIAIYKMSGLEADAIYIQYRAKTFFSNLRNQQEKAVLLNAEKCGCSHMVAKQIKEGKRISYYDGLFDLYNPFPFTENW